MNNLPAQITQKLPIGTVLCATEDSPMFIPVKKGGLVKIVAVEEFRPAARDLGAIEYLVKIQDSFSLLESEAHIKFHLYSNWAVTQELDGFEVVETKEETN